MTAKPITRREWDALGNPPGSFDAVVEMARENDARLRLGPPSRLKPHPWDEWYLGERDDETTVLL